MAEFEWPEDLAPYKVMFYLQPHVGGSESPFTRVRKVYGLSAPRWIARMVFRAGYDGVPVRDDQGGYGPRLDSLVADLQGGLNLTRFHDWRRPVPLRPIYAQRELTYLAASVGSSSVRIAGFSPNAIALSVGDYLGGDGRPHLTSRAETLAAGGRLVGAGGIMADDSGVVTVGFNPPLSAAIAAGLPLRWPVTGLFELTSEDAGQNETEVGQPTEYTLDFVESLHGA